MVIMSALAAAAVAGCGGGDKAGGSGGPVTLRVGTDDTPGRPSGAAIEEFARQARRLSGGRIRIKPVFQAAGKPATAWDQRVARMVMDGRLDMGVIPARAWDTEGVTSLRALHAPFLVTSDELVRKIVKSDVAGEMLAGLDKAGVVGLALLPEDLRHPFAFGRPFLKLADFTGEGIRAPRSVVADATLRRLGATPEDLNAASFKHAVADGSVTGAESSFALAASTLPRRATATANVTLYPKVNSLVIGRRAWAKLSDAQRATLREAARATLTRLLRTQMSEDESARRYCAYGGRVLLAAEPDVAAMVAAVQPVYADLEHDAQTKALIVRIRAFKRQVAPPTSVAACAPSTAGGARSGATDTHVLDGIWRINVTYDEGVHAGLPQDVAAHEMGLQTIRMDGGRYDWRWRARDGAQRCPGTYQLTGNRVVLTDRGECQGTWEATFELSGRTIRWSSVRSRAQGDRWDQIVRDLLHGKPWRRIQELRSRAVAFPEGVYRANIPASFLVARGVDASTAATNSGLMTMTFKDGRWLHHTQGPTNEPDCGGTYVVRGDRVSITLDAGPECGTAAGGLLFSATWTVHGGALRFTDVQPAEGDSDVFARAEWGGKPWRKIR